MTNYEGDPLAVSLTMTSMAVDWMLDHSAAVVEGALVLALFSAVIIIKYLWSTRNIWLPYAPNRVQSAVGVALIVCTMLGYSYGRDDGGRVGRSYALAAVTQCQVALQRIGKLK